MPLHAKHPDVLRYHETLNKVVSTSAYGLEGKRETPDGKGMPCPVNHTKHPRPRVVPNRNNKGHHREVRLRTKYDVARHLIGKKALFNVARPDRRLAEYVIDIDDFEDQTDLTYDYAAGWARECFASALPGIIPFIEPSRSYPRKIGLYARFRLNWGRISDPEARRRIEMELSRRFAEAFFDAPPGLSYDRMSGMIRYRTVNPKYDPVLAESTSGRQSQMQVVQLTPAMSDFLFGPGDYGISIASQLGICPLEVSDADIHTAHISAADAEELRKHYPYMLLPEPTTEWVRLTMLEAYEKEKTFYGLEGDKIDRDARFHHRPVLEPEVEHFGTLITGACFACQRGDRPNNLYEYFDWTEGEQGVASLKHLKDFIGKDRLKELRDPPAKPEPDESIGPARISTPGTGIDHELLADPNVEPASRYAAGARSAVREAETREEAVELCLQKWESEEGPSDGDRHDERVSRAERFVDHALEDYDEKAHVKKGEVWFDADADVETLAADLQQIIPEGDLHQARVEHGYTPKGRLRCGRLTYRLVAHTACWLLKGWATGNIGEVPMKAIRQGLAYHGIAVNGSTVSAIFGLLARHGLVQAVGKWAKGQCRKWLVRSTALLRPWLGQLPQEAVQLVQTASAEQGSTTYVVPQAHGTYAGPAASGASTVQSGVAAPPMIMNRVAPPSSSIQSQPIGWGWAVPKQVWGVATQAVTSPFGGGKQKSRRNEPNPWESGTRVPSCGHADEVVDSERVWQAQGDG